MLKYNQTLRRPLMKNTLNNKPTKEQWERLYDAALKIGQLKPWEKLYDMDLLTILLPDQEEPIFCSVMGRAGECYGIGIYLGYESINKFMQIANLDGTEGLSSLTTMLSQDCLMCYFGDRDEITPDDREPMKMLGLKFRGHNNWIYFRSMKPGMYPWYINGEQAALMTEVLENLNAAYKYLIEGKLEVDFENGETLLRQYSPEQKAWINTKAPIKIPVIKRSLIIDNQILTTRLKKQKMTLVELELDMLYIPNPIQEKDDMIPWMPRIVLMADRQSGIILNQHILNKDTLAEEIIIETLEDYIMEHGRPSTIYVRNENIGCYLNDLCEKIKVKLVMDEDFLAVDEIFDSLMDYMR